jgi:carboxypeptidase D
VNDILPGETNPIFTGSGTTQGFTLWPSATIAAWDSFIATATTFPTVTKGNSAVSHVTYIGVTLAVALVGAVVLII